MFVSGSRFSVTMASVRPRTDGGVFRVRWTPPVGSTGFGVKQKQHPSSPKRTLHHEASTRESRGEGIDHYETMTTDIQIHIDIDFYMVSNACRVDWHPLTQPNNPPKQKKTRGTIHPSPSGVISLYA